MCALAVRFGLVEPMPPWIDLRYDPKHAPLGVLDPGVLKLTKSAAGSFDFRATPFQRENHVIRYCSDCARLRCAKEGRAIDYDAIVFPSKVIQN
jgi:hypothetical protein